MNEPFEVFVKDGLLTDVSKNAPKSFLEVLDMIKLAEGDALVREFGVGLNKFMGKFLPVNDVTAFERQLGFHVSLGNDWTLLFPNNWLNNKQLFQKAKNTMFTTRQRSSKFKANKSFMLTCLLTFNKFWSTMRKFSTFQFLMVHLWIWSDKFLFLFFRKVVFNVVYLCHIQKTTIPLFSSFFAIINIHTHHGFSLTCVIICLLTNLRHCGQKRCDSQQIKFFSQRLLKTYT